MVTTKVCHLSAALNPWYGSGLELWSSNFRGHEGTGMEEGLLSNHLGATFVLT